MDAARVLAGLDPWAIIEGENLEVMRSLPPRSVHLVYGDALYNTGRDFRCADGTLAYSDRFDDLDAYLADLRERCAAARDLLTDDGQFVLQTDPEVSHYVKVMLDGLFGRACYRNEIVWRYRRWTTATPDFQRMHDVLFRYSRSATTWTWNQLHEPLSPKTVAIHGTKRQRHTVTEKGRKWGAQVPNDAEEDSPGALMSDVWEIGIIAPKAPKRTGYPTQKPDELARRVVVATTNPGDVVLDPWCGSGTHIAVAVEHDRRGIGIDRSPVAVRVAMKRLRDQTSQADWLRDLARGTLPGS
jgi:site-specific DNA-methyltransferase (adenine-specific)